MKFWPTNFPDISNNLYVVNTFILANLHMAIVIISGKFIRWSPSIDSILLPAMLTKERWEKKICEICFKIWGQSLSSIFMLELHKKRSSTLHYLMSGHTVGIWCSCHFPSSIIKIRSTQLHFFFADHFMWRENFALVRIDYECGRLHFILIFR